MLFKLIEGAQSIADWFMNIEMTGDVWAGIGIVFTLAFFNFLLWVVWSRDGEY